MVRVFAFAASAFAGLIVLGQAVEATGVDTDDFVIDIESEGKALNWKIDECPPGLDGCDIGSDEPNQYMTSAFDGKIKNIRVKLRVPSSSYKQRRSDSQLLVKQSDEKPPYFKQYLEKPRGFIVMCRSELSDIVADIATDEEDGSVNFSCEKQYKKETQQKMDNEALDQPKPLVTQDVDNLQPVGETFTYTTAFEPQGIIVVDGYSVGFKVKGVKKVEHRFNEKSLVADGSISTYTARLNGYNAQNAKPIMYYESGEGNAKSITVVTGGTYARAHVSRPRNRYKMRNNGLYKNAVWPRNRYKRRNNGLYKNAVELLADNPNLKEKLNSLNSLTDTNMDTLLKAWKKDPEMQEYLINLTVKDVKMLMRSGDLDSRAGRKLTSQKKMLKSLTVQNMDTLLKDPEIQEILINLTVKDVEMLVNSGNLDPDAGRTLTIQWTNVSH